MLERTPPWLLACEKDLLIDDNNTVKSEEKALVRLHSSPCSKRRALEVGEPTRKRICPFGLASCPGCKTIYDPPDEEQHSRHEMLFWRTMADIAGMHSPALQFVQIRQSFINSYFSMGVINSNQQYFNIFYSLAPQSPAMNASRDALCLIHIGSRCKSGNY